MRAVLFSFLVFVLSGCESYHVFWASQSLGPEQAPHIEALSKMSADKAEHQNQGKIIYLCEYYPAGMGGFSMKCLPR